MTARASQHLPPQSSACPPYRNPDLMPPAARLSELAQILANAYLRATGRDTAPTVAKVRHCADPAPPGNPLAGSSRIEPSCDRPRGTGAARARRGQPKHEERKP